MKELNEEEIFVRKELEEAFPQLQINCKNVCGVAYNKHGHDLLAMCIEFYLEKTLEYQLKVINDGKLVNFLTYLMNFQLKRNTTRYHYHYRKWDLAQRELYPDYNYGRKYTGLPEPFKDEEDEAVTCLKKAIEGLDVYQKMIVDEHIQNGEKVTKLSKKYKINYQTLKKDIDQLKLTLKRKCKHYRQ